MTPSPLPPDPLAPSDPWPLCMERLAAELPLEDVHTWLKPLQASPQAHAMVLYAPNAFVRDAVQEAVISTVNDNFDDVYHAVREGYAAGYSPTENGGWEESVDTGNIYAQLAATLGLTSTGSGYASYAGDELEYTLSELTVTLSNNGLASGESEGYLANATLVLEIPTGFAGRILPPVRMLLRVQAKYIPKF